MELSEFLRGTCNDVQSGLSACGLPDVDRTDLEADLENEGDISLCPTCGWWVEGSEIWDEEGNCEDCSRESS